MCRQEIKYSSSSGNNRNEQDQARQNEVDRERRAQEARRIIFGVPFDQNLRDAPPREARQRRNGRDRRREDQN